MRTKQTKPLGLFLLLSIFSFSLFTTDLKGQNDFAFSSGGHYLRGIQTLQHNPWNVMNNPALTVPENKFTYGIGWTGILVGSGLNAFSAAAQGRRSQTGIGFQFNRTGYAVSNNNEMAFSLAQNWNERVSSGLSIKFSSFNVRGETPIRNTPNITLGTNVKFEKVHLAFVAFNPIPNKTVGISSFRLSSAMRYQLNTNTNLFVESVFSIQQKTRLNVVAERKILSKLDLYLGLSPSPASINFGLNINLNKGKSAFVSNHCNFQFANQPSLAFTKS